MFRVFASSNAQVTAPPRSHKPPTTTMFPPSKLPSAAALLSAYNSLAGYIMLIRTMADHLIPYPVRPHVEWALHYLFTPLSSRHTIIIDDSCGICANQLYAAADFYLPTIVSPDADRLRATKASEKQSLHVTNQEEMEIIDTFHNYQLRWKPISVPPPPDWLFGGRRYYELTFDKRLKDKVLKDYLPFVLEKSKEIAERREVVKLYTKDPSYDEYTGGTNLWQCIELGHPSTFETLAIDPLIKKMIVDDVERFLKRKDFYRKVGKAWKRGYLLYGPPGTGKTSLIAAMANQLKFDIYYLELSNLSCDSELTKMLLLTKQKSMIVIEDIDCSGELKDRELHGKTPNSKRTLSGVLNAMDGLWSCIGEERIVVFTTNRREQLDPDILRPGRMDMHIHMSYCNIQAFRILVANYLGIHHHHNLLGEIERLVEKVAATPAEVAEELMASEDVDTALAGVLNLLKHKQIEANESKGKNKCT